MRDPDLCKVLELLAGRRRGDARLLCHQMSRRWVPLQAGDVNDHIRELFGLEVTAKDFRTWHATVHVAAELGRSTATTKTARKKAVRSAVVSASELLGNTPTVCKSSYVDPRVLDLYEHDVTIDAVAGPPAARRGQGARPAGPGRAQAADRLTGTDASRVTSAPRGLSDLRGQLQQPDEGLGGVGAGRAATERELHARRHVEVATQPARARPPQVSPACWPRPRRRAR